MRRDSHCGDVFGLLCLSIHSSTYRCQYQRARHPTQLLSSCQNTSFSSGSGHSIVASFSLWLEYHLLLVWHRNTKFVFPSRNIIKTLWHLSYGWVCINWLNSLRGKYVLARSLKTHRFNLTYVGIVRKTSRRPTSNILNHLNHGTIVTPIWMKTMAIMVGIPWWQLRESLTDALVNVACEMCNWRVSLDYIMYNIKLHNAWFIASPLHQPTMVNAAAIDHSSGNADHPYRL